MVKLTIILVDGGNIVDGKLHISNIKARRHKSAYNEKRKKFEEDLERKLQFYPERVRERIRFNELRKFHKELRKPTNIDVEMSLKPPVTPSPRPGEPRKPKKNNQENGV